MASAIPRAARASISAGAAEARDAAGAGAEAGRRPGRSSPRSTMWVPTRRPSSRPVSRVASQHEPAVGGAQPLHAQPPALAGLEEAPDPPGHAQPRNELHVLEHEVAARRHDPPSPSEAGAARYERIRQVGEEGRRVVVEHVEQGKPHRPDGPSAPAGDAGHALQLVDRHRGWRLGPGRAPPPAARARHAPAEEEAAEGALDAAAEVGSERRVAGGRRDIEARLRELGRHPLGGLDRRAQVVLALEQEHRARRAGGRCRRPGRPRPRARARRA